MAIFAVLSVPLFAIASVKIAGAAADGITPQPFLPNPGPTPVVGGGITPSPFLPNTAAATKLSATPPLTTPARLDPTAPPNPSAWSAFQSIVAQDIEFLYSTITPASLASYCVSSAFANFSAWSALSWNGGLASPTVITEVWGDDCAYCNSAYYPNGIPPTFKTGPGQFHTAVLTSAATPVYEPPGFRVPPCCGECTVVVSTVQLMYWQTPLPPGTTSFVSDGFSFISPSAYIVFESAYAVDDCHLQDHSTVTTVTTVPIAPTDLTSILFNSDVRVTTTLPVNLADLGPSCAAYAYDYQHRSPPFTQWHTIDGTTFWDRKCWPQLAIPTAFIDGIPNWTGCIPQLGSFDPPYVLTAAANADPASPTATPSAAAATQPGPTATAAAILLSSVGPSAAATPFSTLVADPIRSVIIVPPPPGSAASTPTPPTLPPSSPTSSAINNPPIITTPSPTGDLGVIIINAIGYTSLNAATNPSLALQTTGITGWNSSYPTIVFAGGNQLGRIQAWGVLLMVAVGLLAVLL